METPPGLARHVDEDNDALKYYVRHYELHRQGNKVHVSDCAMFIKD